MSRKFHGEAGIELPFSPAATMITIDNMTGNEHALMLLAEIEGRIVGVLAASINRHHFTAATVAQELIWYIEHQYRGRGAIKMLSLYEEWAVKAGCEFVTMVGIGSDPFTTKIYERKGFKAQERHFVKRLG